MIRSILAALAVVVLAFTLSYPAVAQDKPMQEQGKDMPKQEMSKDMSKDMKMTGLKMVSCDPACGFRVVSHNEAEITEMVKMHAKKMHNKEMTDADVKKMMKDAPTKGMKEGTTGETKPKY